MILALETSTYICSVALQTDQATVYEHRTDRKGSHSEQLFLFVRELMSDHGFTVTDLECILVSEGPGSYTGLRIGAGAVKGLLFDTGIPLFAINTLAGFAEGARMAHPEPGAIHTIIDARRKHLYYRKFMVEKGVIVSQNDAEVRPIKEIQNLIEEGDAVIGTGIERLGESALEKVTVFGDHYISARSLISLYEGTEGLFAREVNPDSFDPKYYTSNQVRQN